MTVNVPLLRKTLEHVESHPEEWTQDIWLCRTSACFAGHAVLIDGGKWGETENSVFVRAEPEDDPADVRTPIAGEGPMVTVPERARRILGIGYTDSRRLFDSDNTLDDLRRIVAELSEDTP